MNNLPGKAIQDSAKITRLFFDSYGEKALEFTANEIDFSIGFFTSKGFDPDAAAITALTILKQARIEKRPVGGIIESLKDLNGLQLTEYVARVINNNRVSTSLLGYKSQSITNKYVARNIKP
jgi:hypothetical protein